MASPCPRRPSSISTSTPSTRSSTGRAGSPRSPRGRRSSRCRRSRSPTTARSPARSSSTARREEAGDQADRRLRGLRRRRPPGAGEGLRAPDRPRRDERGLREPDQALVARLPGGLLLQAARRLGAARAAREGLVVLSGCLSGRVWKALEGSRPQDAAADLDRLVQIFGRDRPTSRSRTPDSSHSSGSTRSSRSSPRGPGCRSSRPATSTTSATRTRARTRRCCASSRATR